MVAYFTASVSHVNLENSILGKIRYFEISIKKKKNALDLGVSLRRIT